MLLQGKGLFNFEEERLVIFSNFEHVSHKRVVAKVIKNPIYNIITFVFLVKHGLKFELGLVNGWGLPKLYK